MLRRLQGEIVNPPLLAIAHTVRRLKTQSADWLMVSR
jgi:hypothetical protein